MTQIITAITENSIILASDIRLNYREEIEEEGRKYQIYKIIADCCRKTFYLDKAKVGIQFIGIGYLKAGDESYHLSYFLPKIQEGIKGKQKIKLKMKIIFNNLKKITTKGDSNNFVNGVMAGFSGNKIFIGNFNMYNDEIEIKEAKNRNFIDSEKIIENLSNNKDAVLIQIDNSIKEGSKRKPHLIGSKYEVLEITKKDSRYILENERLFSGTKKELFEKFKDDLQSINGQILNPPIKERLNV